MGIVVLGAVFVDIKGYPLANYIPGGRLAASVICTMESVCPRFLPAEFGLDS